MQKETLKKAIITAAFAVGSLIVVNLLNDREEREERKRSNAWHGFEGILTEEQFQDMALEVSMVFPRIKAMSFTGAAIHATVESISGLSTWGFFADFNDYGMVTGSYWLDSENEESDIPYLFADALAEKIMAVLDESAAD